MKKVRESTTISYRKCLAIASQNNCFGYRGGFFLINPAFPSFSFPLLMLPSAIADLPPSLLPQLPHTPLRFPPASPFPGRQAGGRPTYPPPAAGAREEKGPRGPGVPGGQGRGGGGPPWPEAPAVAPRGWGAARDSHAPGRRWQPARALAAAPPTPVAPPPLSTPHPVGGAGGGPRPGPPPPAAHWRAPPPVTTRGRVSRCWAAAAIL